MRRSAFWLLITGFSALALMIAGVRSFEPVSAFAQVGSPPVLVSISPNPETVTAGGTAAILIEVDDPDQTPETLVLSLTGAPAGVILQQPDSSGFGDITWDTTLADVGTHIFTVTLTDDDLNVDTDSITIIVELPPTETNTSTPTATITPGGPTLTASPTFTPTNTPIIIIVTATFSPTLSPTPSPTLTRTFPPLPSLTPIPSSTPLPTATFIPPLATETPLPRPANAGQAVPLPGARVRFVVNRDGVNVRRIPAIGAALEGIVNAGFTALADAISGDGEWLRFIYFGNDAWIGFPTISVIEGDIGALPIADPRTIPYGGFENPRAGLSSVEGPLKVRLEDSGIRVRSGPGLGYLVLGNAPRYEIMSLLGRNETGDWLQVNFRGTLGWIATRYVQFLDIAAIQQVPIGGIVADALPISRDTFSGYVDTLKLLLSRIELAIPSLEQIRAIWTAAALGGELQCGTFPIRPTDYAVPNALLAAFYGTLNDLANDFNLAMGNLRRAIDLLSAVCQQTGQADAGTIQQALDLINQVDGLFADLRARLLALIPPELEFDPNEACLFTFNNRSEVVGRLRVNVVRSVHFDSSSVVAGFCFDGEVGRSYKLEVLAYTGNPRPRASVSAFTNPTNFLAVGQATADRTLVTLAPILIPATGQYLVILSDLEVRNAVLEGDVAVLLTDVTGIGFSTTPNLFIDPVTGQLIVNPIPNSGASPVLPGSGGVPTGGLPPIDGFFCPNPRATCAELAALGGTCNTARACYQQGNFSLDEDGDGIPCEATLCFGQDPFDP